jgi:hypothetical protein
VCLTNKKTQKKNKNIKGYKKRLGMLGLGLAAQV